MVVNCYILFFPIPLFFIEHIPFRPHSSKIAHNITCDFLVARSSGQLAVLMLFDLSTPKRPCRLLLFEVWSGRVLQRHRINRRTICVDICMAYYKELTHVTLVAEKFQNMLSACWRPRRDDGVSSSPSSEA